MRHTHKGGGRMRVMNRESEASFRIRKNEEELGLLASEEDRKFGSKDQNQIWNRVSKRVFRPRRKGKDSFDYISSSSNSWVLHIYFQLAC